MSADPIRHILDLLQAGRLADADRACDQVLQSRPTFPPALSLAGMIALQQGDYARALQRTALAAVLDPRNAASESGLGFALQMAGDARGALEAFRRAAALDPNAA